MCWACNHIRLPRSRNSKRANTHTIGVEHRDRMLFHRLSLVAAALGGCQSVREASRSIEKLSSLVLRGAALGSIDLIDRHHHTTPVDGDTVGAVGGVAVGLLKRFDRGEDISSCCRVCVWCGCRGTNLGVREFPGGKRKDC